MLKTLSGLFSFSLARLSGANKALFFSVALTAAFALAAAVILPILQRDMIEGVQSGAMSNPLVIAMFIASLLGIFCAVFESLALNKLSKNVANRMQREMITSAVRYSNELLAARGAGGYFASANGGAEYLVNTLSTNYFSLLLVFLQAAFITAIASAWSWVFVAVVAPIYALSIVIILVSSRMHAKYYALGHKNVVELNPKVLERLENRLSMLAFADVAVVENALFDMIDERDSNFIKRGMADSISRIAVQALSAFGLVALFLLSMPQISAGNLGIASFVAMLSYYAGVFVPLSAFRTLAQATKGFEFTRERFAKEFLGQKPITGLPKSGELKFDSCAFAYDEGDSGRIENFSLDIDRRIGLVGMSGEGKSTLIKILLGGVSPSKGACSLGGVEIPRVAKGALHSMVKLYTQDPQIFDDSLEYNITLGKKALGRAEHAQAIRGFEARLRDLLKRIDEGKPIGASRGDTCAIDIVKELFLLNDWQLKDAALLAEIAAELKGAREMLGAFAEILTDRKFYIAERYDALVEDLGLRHLSGRALGQHGQNVSGGEKSKVCLARFLLPARKGFYVIDEPFTAVDAISEEQCIRALRKYLDSNGGITISHKLNVIRAMSDDIAVLSKGEILERGSHDELVRLKGLYADLYGKFAALK